MFWVEVAQHLAQGCSSVNTGRGFYIFLGFLVLGKVPAVKWQLEAREAAVKTLCASASLSLGVSWSFDSQ